MKMRSSKLLSILLAIVMVLSTFGIVSFAEETETETTPAQTEYYAKAGATGDGRTAETPAGSLATVIAAINADGHTTGDNVTVYIMRGDNEVFVYTEDMISAMTPMYLVYSQTPHAATITYTSYDAEAISSMVFSTNYQMSGHTGAHVNLAGPSRFVNLRFIDQRVTSQCDIACHGYDADFIGVTLVSANTGTTIAAGAELPDGTIAAAATATVNLLKDTWNGHLRMGTNSSSSVINRGGVVRIENTTGIADVNLGAYSSDVKYMTTNEDVTLYYGKGTLPKLALDSKNNSPAGSVAYNLYKKNVNVVLNGTTVTNFTNLNTNVTGAVLLGALQIIYNDGAVIKNDTATRWADTAKKVPFTNEYQIVAPAGVTVDVTETAGIYTVTGDKVVYTLSGDGKYIYYSVDGKINIRKPGKYTLATADSLEAVFTAVGTPELDEKYQFLAWTQAYPGLAFCDYVLKTEAEEGVYYVRDGATGDGLTAATAGSPKTVIAAINAKYKEGDTVTVKVVRGKDDGLSWWENEEVSGIRHVALTDLTAHDATIVLTSADPDELSRVVWFNSYKNDPNSAGGASLELYGDLVLENIRVVDTRTGYHWDLYARDHDFTVGANVTWNHARSATRYYMDRSYQGTWSAGSRTASNSKGFKKAAVHTYSDNSFDKVTLFSFSGYDTTGNVIFPEDVTFKFGKGTAKDVVLDNMNGKYAKFSNNVNLVLNGTVVKTFHNRSGKTTELMPIVGGAIQIIRNNGATVTSTATAFSDDARTTATPIWDITVESGAVLDVTATAGVYTVEDNIVYLVDTENKKIYYWDDVVDLTPFGAGTYSLGSAANIQAIPVPDCIEIPDNKRFAGWIEEDPENPGVLVAQIVDKTNNYYVQYGGTGSGRSPEFPIGTIQNVIKLINADGLDADDEATVYLVPTGNEPTNEQLNYSSAKQGEAPIKVDTPNGFISYIAPNIAHTATITYTTYNYDATKDNKMILANGDTVKSKNGRDGTGHMYLCGPTVFKDIYVIDLRMDNAAWDFYTQSHDFEMINVDWRRTTGKWENGVATGTPGYTHNPWNNHFYGGNHGNTNNNYSPATDADFEMHIDNADFIYDLSLGSRVNQDGTVKAGVSTYRIGNDTKTGVIEELYIGSISTTTIAQQNGTINAIFNNTIINKSKYSSTKVTNSETGEVTVTEYIPVITNVQLLLNNGSVLKANDTKLDGNLYILTAGEGVELDITETAGTYTVDVAEGMYAIATDGTNKYYSVIADGAHTITVPKGTYTVTASAPYSYADGVVTALVNGAKVDLAELETENTGKIFLGWTLSDGSYVDLAASTVITLDAGETCTASYKEFTFDTEESDMYVLGAQIRITYAQDEESSDVADLRFISQIKKSFLAEQFGINEYIGGEDVKYGHIVLPAEEKYRAEGEMLEFGKTTSKGYDPEKVPAVKIYDNEGDFVKFTVCLTDILPAKYGRCFAVRPYVCYTDKNGVEQYIYGEQYETASLVTVAQAGKAKAEEDGTEIPDIIKAILNSVVTE